MSHYDFSIFRDACSKLNGSVIVLANAERDAREHFKLAPQDEIFAFIGNGGLEKLEFQNTTPLRKNPFPDTEIFVDAYEFLSLFRLGYLAFYKFPTTGKWVIKSFKPSLRRNNLFTTAFDETDLIE